MRKALLVLFLVGVCATLAACTTDDYANEPTPTAPTRPTSTPHTQAPTPTKTPTPDPTKPPVKPLGTLTWLSCKPLGVLEGCSVYDVVPVQFTTCEQVKQEAYAVFRMDFGHTDGDDDERDVVTNERHVVIVADRQTVGDVWYDKLDGIGFDHITADQAWKLYRGAKCYLDN